MKSKLMFLNCFLCVLLVGCAGVAMGPEDADTNGAALDGTPIPPELGREVVMQAMGALGVRYAFGGTSPASGFDCSGLVVYAYFRASEHELPRTTYALSRSGMRINLRDLRPGDLVFYNTQRRPYSHVGIYIGGQRFIHAPSSGESVRIESMRQRYWLRRFDGARRMVLEPAPVIGPAQGRPDSAVGDLLPLREPGRGLAVTRSAPVAAR
jgi:cell wall-associated NlpC family hydrolase